MLFSRENEEKVHNLIFLHLTQVQEEVENQQWLFQSFRLLQIYNIYETF